jgi:hypothetical protein
MARVIIWAVIALVVGLVGGVALALAVGGAPTAPLDCTVNSDDTVTTCVNEYGNEVDVPHDIHITNR